MSDQADIGNVTAIRQSENSLQLQAAAVGVRDGKGVKSNWQRPRTLEFPEDASVLSRRTQTVLENIKNEGTVRLVL